MANARPGGPRRPDLDYYEYKRMHEQRLRQEEAQSADIKPAVPTAPRKPSVNAPAREKAFAAPQKPVKGAPPEALDAPDLLEEDALDLPGGAAALPPEEDALDLPEEKRSLFSGVRQLMKGVAHRLPEDEPDEDGDQEPSRRREEPETPEPEDEDDALAALDEMDDGPQIDNPIGDAFVKVKGLFHAARTKLAERRAAGSAGEEPEDEADEETRAQDAGVPEDSEAPVLSRRMRKAAQAKNAADEPPIVDIEPMDVREVDELVSRPGITVHAGFAEDEPAAQEPSAEADAPEDDQDDDDDLPAARGTRIFGFFKRMRGRSAAPEDDEEPIDAAQPDGEDQFMDEDQRAALTQRLSEELESAPSLSRKERKALAARKAAAAVPAAAPAPAARPAAPAVPAAPAAAIEPAPSRTAYPVDEPTQQFRPLRARPLRPASSAPARPVEIEEEAYDEDEDDDLPVRRAPKPARERKRRVYQDEDLEEDEYDDDRYDDEYDEYDDYDDYDDDDRYDDEYHVSGGRRFLGFLKGLVVFILFLALCVLALRQLESSRLISLGGLRDTVGQIVPINLILPSPAPEETVQPGETEVAAEPTLAPTQAPEETAPAETPGADIAQVEPTDGEERPNM